MGNRHLLDLLLGEEEVGQEAPSGSPWRWKYRMVTETVRSIVRGWTHKGLNRLAHAILESDVFGEELLDFLQAKGIEKFRLTGIDAALEQMSQPVREVPSDPVDEALRKQRNARDPIQPSNAEYVPTPAETLDAAEALVAEGKYRWVFKEGAYRLHPFDWSPAVTFEEARALLASRQYKTALTLEKFTLVPVAPHQYDKTGAQVRPYRDTRLGFDASLVDDEVPVGKVRHNPEACGEMLRDLGFDPLQVRLDALLCQRLRMSDRPEEEYRVVLSFVDAEIAKVQALMDGGARIKTANPECSPSATQD